MVVMIDHSIVQVLYDTSKGNGKLFREELQICIGFYRYVSETNH